MTASTGGAGSTLPPVLVSAIDGADEVWLEVEPDPAGSPLIAELGIDTTRALSVIAGVQRWNRVVAACQSLGIDPADLDMLRPWLAAQTLDSALRRESTDEAVRTLAGDRARFEMRLEGAVRLFAGLDDEAQFGLLDWTVEVVDGAAQWSPEAQETRLREVSPGFHQRVLVARNRDWVLRIEDMLDADSCAVVSVGALHLVGDDGIPALLTARGLPVAGELAG